MVDSGRATRWLTAATWVYVVVVLAVALTPDRLLGHDEAVYAVGARGLWSGEAADEFPLHRSIGMRVLAAPGVAAGGGDELAIRIPFALIALGYLAAVYLIARRWFGPAAAALAIAVQATMAPWLWRAAEALSDIPSALALLGVVGLCAGAGEDRSPRAWARAVAAGGLAAIACYLRYASAPAVAAIFAVALASDPRSWRWLMIAGLAGVVGIAPFLIWSSSETGSVLGVLDTGERMARRSYPGDGLVFYLKTWPYRLAGPVGGAVAAIGVVVGLRAWRAGFRTASPADRARRLLATAALGQMVSLGWRVHGETRFVFFAVSCLSIVGAAWLAGTTRRWIAAVGAVGLTAIPSAVGTLYWLDQRADSRTAFAETTAAIRADAAGASCLVFSTEVPMTIWYTGCRTLQVDSWGFDVQLARGARQIYLLEARGLPRSIHRTEALTRPALGWRLVSCGDRESWCLWRATTAPPAP